MRKIFFLLIIVGFAFVIYNRQRLFVRDPLGEVLRNGLKEVGAQVYINFSNEVLIENDGPPMYTTIVQHGQPVGTPAQLKCLHYVACMTDADKATLSATAPGAEIEFMNSADVIFRSSGGKRTVVRLH